MKWTQWIAATASLGLLAMAGCAEKDPVSSAIQEEPSDLSPTAKLVTTAAGISAPETRALVAVRVVKDGAPAGNVNVAFTRNRRAY